MRWALRPDRSRSSTGSSTASSHRGERTRWKGDVPQTALTNMVLRFPAADDAAAVASAAHEQTPSGITNPRTSGHRWDIPEASGEPRTFTTAVSEVISFTAARTPTCCYQNSEIRHEEPRSRRGGSEDPRLCRSRRSMRSKRPSLPNSRRWSWTPRTSSPDTLRDGEPTTMHGGLRAVWHYAFRTIEPGSNAVGNRRRRSRFDGPIHRCASSKPVTPQRPRNSRRRWPKASARTPNRPRQYRGCPRRSALMQRTHPS